MSTTETKTVYAPWTDGNRKVLLRGDWAFSNGETIEPTDELIGILRILDESGVKTEAVHNIPNVIAFRFRDDTRGGATKWVVQYPLVDDATIEGLDGKHYGFDVATFRAEAWPCLLCTVSDGGTLGIWPDSIAVDPGRPLGTEPVHHTVCLVHGEVAELEPYDEVEGDSDDDYPPCGACSDADCPGGCLPNSSVLRRY